MGEAKKYILDKNVTEKKMQRMAYEILENNMDENYIVLAGIHESGSVVARTIQKLLAGISDIRTEMITITLDKRSPKEVKLDKNLDFNDKVIIVIDDVVNSGKTLLYALKPFLEFQPKKIQTLVLVDRKHKAFSVQADYVGLSIATGFQQHVYVEVSGDTVNGAYLK